MIIGKPHRAFTLVEMVVAIAVTLALVVIMVQIFVSGSNLWTKNNERLDTFREARAALQMMARDLSGVNPVPGLPDQFPVLALQYHPSTAGEDKVNQEVYGLTSVSNSGKSDLCAVGYFCAWDANKSTFVLKRQFTESNTTFANLRQALPLASPMTGQGAFNVLFARPLNSTAAANSTSTQSVDDMASYVWDLQFITPTTGNPPQTVKWPQGYFWKEMPLWVEIRFKALGATAARKLEGSQITRDVWFSPDSDIYKRMILPNEQQFVTRVKLCR